MFRSVIPFSSKQPKFHMPFLAGLLLFTLVSLFLVPAEGESSPLKSSSTTKISGKGMNGIFFVKNEKCGQCHPKQFKEWKTSHHDLAMQPANDKTVLGDFSNARFTHHGVTSTFFKRDGKFFIRTDGPGGKLHDYEIKYVFGFEPLQQYIIEFPGGRMQLPDIAWDTHPKEKGGQRWFHLHPDEKITPKHIFHWTRRFLNWNYMCAECHSTNLQKNYDLETNTFKTSWNEIDVSCQACHGPGSKHVEWARSANKSGNNNDKNGNAGLEINFKSDNSHVEIEACARCHARRNGLRKDYQYGKPFMDFYVPRVLLDPLYYPDGQILDEVYVYGSFIQSKKYQQGVRCTDCHNPHTARLHVSGNALCNRCHSSLPKQRFATVTLKNYDTSAHHFHKQNSPGAKCVECHMPETKYMIVDPRRDHNFQIPRPDLSLKLNTPNSCNRCHKDKSFKWSADKINEWYPMTKGIREKEIHFAEIFAAGQAGKTEAESGLVKIARDESHPAIIRATAINILSRYRSRNSLNVTALSLKDDDPLVRYESVRGISAMLPKILKSDTQKIKYSLLVPLLKDPIRAVRTEAARALIDVATILFKSLHRKEYEKALDEYKQRQESIADRPEAHLNLGLMYQNMGQNNMAEAAYKTAIRLVSDYVPARVNLANLYNQLGKNDKAENQLRAAILSSPKQGDLYYSLGLLLAEEKKFDEAAKSLGKAARLNPYRLRVHYNHGLTLQRLGRRKEAEAAFRKAFWLNQKDPRTLQALAILYMQQRRWEQSKGYAEKLVRLFPKAPGPRRMLREIQRQMKK